jgi:hypothetical protein
MAGRRLTSTLLTMTPPAPSSAPNPPLVTLSLAQLAHARSGDKGDVADIGLFAWEPLGFALLTHHVTVPVVAAHFAHLWPHTLTASSITSSSNAPRVECHALPQLLAQKWLLRDALNGGAASSLRSDNLGKTIAAQLLRLRIQVSQAEADAVLQATARAIAAF